MKRFATTMLALVLFSFTFNELDSSFVRKGIVVVQYNAGFNKSNNIDLDPISDAKVITAYIDGDNELKEYGKVLSVPTIVLYENKKEIKRWEAGLSMKLSISHKDIQEEVDKLTGVDKF